MTAVARARGVSYRYGSAPPSVSGVDLEVGAGEVAAVIGPNGAGKSTLLRLMTGRLRPTEGSVEPDLAPTHRDGAATMGYGGEETAHFEALSGFRNACFFVGASGFDRKAAWAAVVDHFEVMGLSEKASERVSTYSHGNRRKLLLVEALAHRPHFVVLDEPTTGLDATSRDALVGLLRTRRSEGAGILLASHDLDFVTELADRITFLHRGRVVAAGDPRGLLASVVGPTTRFEIMLDERPKRAIDSFGPDVTLVAGEGDAVVLETSRGQAALPDACTALVEAGAQISGISVREAGLAEVFRRVTGEDLIDGRRT